ncbi:hypothetical protein FRC03_012416 [Tulasnella sp. 419]|nr:hypothetical protein FRC02_000615 [Tulasnella sp. 418]KAG8969963.1 hypothetical protein FRC03_012416 [Tulasnella sp. 419]
MKVITTYSLLLASLSGSLALDVVGTIAWNDICRDVNVLKPAHVVLDSGRWKANVLRSGNFTIRDVEPGSYVLEVQARDHFFDQLRVDIVPSDPVPTTTTLAPSATPSILTPSYNVEARPIIPGTPHDIRPLPARVQYPLVLTPRAKKIYITPKQDFSIVAMFKSNPMMLMMLGSVGFMLLMPKLLSSMDPEDRKEFLERQNKMMSMQTSMKDSLDISSGFSKLLGGPDQTEGTGEGDAQPPSKPSGSSPSGKKTKGKRR